MNALSADRDHVVLCLFAETTEFCFLNVTSSDLAILADTDNVTVRCDINYRAESHWVPRVQCLPNIIGQNELTEKTAEGIAYTKSFSAAPDINGVVINCTAKFNSTGYEPRFRVAYDAPNNVHLWQSAPLQVLCKH